MLVLGLINVPWYLLWPIGLLLAFLLYTWHKKSYFRRLGIPARNESFIFGDLPILAKKGFFYIDADFVRDNGKVCGKPSATEALKGASVVYLGNAPQLIINDSNIIKQIMVKHFSKFSDRAVAFAMDLKLESSLTFAKGSYWKYLRMLLGPSFTSGKLRKMESHITCCIERLEQIIDREIDTHPDGIDITPFLDNFTLDVICMVGFGQQQNAQENLDDDFVQLIKSILNVELGSNVLVLLSLLFPNLKYWFQYFRLTYGNPDIYNRFRDTINRCCAKRSSTQQSQNDLLQLMVTAHKDEELGHAEDIPLSVDDYKKRGLTEEEIVMNSQSFITAGYDGTAATLAWLFYDLVLNPECQGKLIHEIDKQVGKEKPGYDNVRKLAYLDMVVNESLRMHPTTARITREAAEDIEIEGVKIKKGLDCAVTTLALHFMPEYWENPTVFNPDRFAPDNKDNIDQYAFLPFGVGPRHCIGVRLVLLEVKMTLVALLQKYRFTKTEALQVPMPIQKVIVLKPAKPVLVKVERREL